jgi:hypothetical protein
MLTKEPRKQETMTDPRIPIMKQPVDEPVIGRAAASVGRALRHPVDEPLWGTDARIIGSILRRP